MIRVMLVDDQELVRSGFAMLLNAQDDLEVVGEAGDGAAAVALAADVKADVVLMDVRMPGMDGIEATREITSAHPDTRVLVLTTFDLDEYVYAALQAGASGFLLKDAPGGRTRTTRAGPIGPGRGRRPSMPCCARWRRPG